MLYVIKMDWIHNNPKHTRKKNENMPYELGYWTDEDFNKYKEFISNPFQVISLVG